MASTGFHCPQCGKGIETNDENGAESMECPYCGKSVPAPSGPPYQQNPLSGLFRQARNPE